MLTPKKVKVEATMAGKVIEWEIDSKKPKDSKLDLAKDSGSYELEFALDDKTGAGLRFDCGYPFGVGEDTGGACPPKGVNSDQIAVMACEPTKLTVVDKNSGRARTLNYQLNFVDGKGKPEEVDPEIRNGGGI